MPELTCSFDVPLETNRVSSEDTQAQLDEGVDRTCEVR
jgi:hypothetical protein